MCPMRYTTFKEVDVFSFKNHLSFCIFCMILIVIKDYSLEAWHVVFLFTALAGCALPDIDHHLAIGGHLIPLHKIFDLINKKKSKKNKRKTSLKHGGITHTLLLNLLLLTIPYTLLGTWDVRLYIDSTWGAIFIGFSFGMYTHLLSDDFDGNSLKYLYWPLKIDLSLLVITPFLFFTYIVLDKSIKFIIDIVL